MRAVVVPWTRGLCALPAEGECSGNEKTSRLRRRSKTDTLPPHHKIRFWSGIFTPCRVVLPAGDGWQPLPAATGGWVRLVFNRQACQCGRIRALGGENDDVALISAPPFYVSKWRIGRFASEQQVPSQQCSVGSEKPCRPLKRVGQRCRSNVAYWLKMIRMRCVVSAMGSRLTFCRHRWEANLG